MMAPREVKKAVRYIRVSRVGDRAGHESYGSPDDQRREIDRTADYKRIEIVGEHVDEDESGGTHDRPGLEAAIAAALSGKVDAIVVQLKVAGFYELLPQ